jgi:hypothetical protein
LIINNTIAVANVQDSSKLQNPIGNIKAKRAMQETVIKGSLEVWIRIKGENII